VERLRDGYRQFLFHRVTDGLLDLCTVDLSAVYLDVVKDRLYAMAPDDPARRSAQTVLWQALHDLAISASPVLVATAEEVWQSHPALVREAESVHLALWPQRPSGTAQESAEAEWEFLHTVRATVNAAIEPLRAAKELATSLEAEVALRGPAAVLTRLAPYRDELPEFLLAARVTLFEDPALQELQADVRRTSMLKCVRCWTHRAEVREGVQDPGLCGRCVEVLAR
jgi:isoleucyl-tRNA synthetase